MTKKEIILPAALCLAFAAAALPACQSVPVQRTAAELTETTGSETQAPTELPTESPTEKPTEPPTEPPTDPPTEPPPPPESVMLDVPFYSQRGVLPTGCELISAKMVLEYYTEEEVPIEDIIDNMVFAYPETVDGKATGPHPEDAFIGSPYDPTSFGCFAPVVVDMMNELLPDGYTAEETTGTPLDKLAEAYLPKGQPVLVWATISMLDSFPHLGWYIADEDGKPTDEWYDWLANEHCLVMVGYDSEYYYFNDPLKYDACYAYKRSLAEERNEEIGGYSIVVQKEGS